MFFSLASPYSPFSLSWFKLLCMPEISPCSLTWVAGFNKVGLSSQVQKHGAVSEAEQPELEQVLLLEGGVSCVGLTQLQCRISYIFRLYFTVISTTQAASAPPKVHAKFIVCMFYKLRDFLFHHFSSLPTVSSILIQ